MNAFQRLAAAAASLLPPSGPADPAAEGDRDVGPAVARSGASDPIRTRWRGRREDARALTGRGRYVTDLAPPGCLHMAVRRADEAGVALTAVDLETARGLPGVVAVLGPEDAARWGRASVNPLVPDMTALPASPLAQDTLSFVGQPVAAVIATDRNAALDAVEAIALDTGSLDTQADTAPTVGKGAVSFTWGPPTETDEGARTVSTAVRHARVAPAAMEPRAALAIPGEDGDLTVYLSTQSAHRGRDDLAAILNLDPARLRVIAPDVGGAFGGKASLYPEDVLVAAAALATGRPVIWTGSRAEDLMAASHGRGAHLQGTATLGPDGRIARIDATGTFPLGGWMPFSSVVPMRNFARILPGPYAIPAGTAEAGGTTDGTAPMGIYRGAGRPEAAMLLERLMDGAARVTGSDPIAYRRRHLRAAADLPTTLPSGDRLDSGDYAKLLDTLEAAVDVPALRAEIERRRAAGEVVGLGVALYVEPCGAGWESARVRLLPDGRIRVESGSSAQGQGRETAYAAIAGDRMGLPADRIEVAHSDTATTPAGIGALASRGTAIGGSAVARAADAMRDALLAAAGTRLQRPVDVLSLTPDGIVATDGSGAKISLADLAESFGADSPVIDLKHEAAAEAWASGAVLAVLAIDPDTGVPTVERIVWADDAGRVLDPVMADGQLLGGLAQGLGEALMERIVYTPDGQLLTGSLMDYALPRAADIPPVAIHHADTPSTANPLGVKGVGEAGCIGVPAAIVNAAIDALSPFGVTDLDPPLTAETLWRAMNGHAFTTDN